MEAAERLGVFDSKRNDIKNGKSVNNNKGETVQPEQVASNPIFCIKLQFHFARVSQTCKTLEC